MSYSEIKGLVSQAPQILTMIYSDLAQPGVKKLGFALETVLEFSTSILLPVKLLNEKFKLNFEKRLNEYKEKLEKIPEEDLCEVNPQVGTPIIEKLSYTTNDEIADLFTNLLTKASSTKTVNLAHPSFAQMIERLSVDEAKIIKHLRNKDSIPTVTFRAHHKNVKGYADTLKNGTGLEENVELMFKKNINTYLDNLSSMGILDNTHGSYLINENAYDVLLKLYDFEGNKRGMIMTGHFSEIESKLSFFEITDFGKSFIKACNP